jgi:hypothetical protein
MVHESQRYPCSAERLRELYERLRDYVFKTVDTPAQIHGLGVIVLRGMAAWIETASQYAQGEDHFDTTRRGTVALQSVEKTQLQAVLTDMIMYHCHREVS